MYWPLKAARLDAIANIKSFLGPGTPAT